LRRKAIQYWCIDPARAYIIKICSHKPTMQELDNTSFYQNLQLTQLFCKHQLLNCDKNAASIFRSINPVRNGKKLFEFKITDSGWGSETRYSFSTEWAQDPLRNGNKLFHELYELQLLQKRAKIESLIASQDFQGRILVAEIDNTVTDGASEVYSDGLIDVYDCPPY
jgi:hypothetical protein